MRMYDIIEKKRDGYELTDSEIEFFVDGYVKGTVPDYQISALLMAIYLRGMTDNETSALTKIMSESGDMLDLSSFGSLSVDKHSTGGVGDKTSLVVTPVVASLGLKVAKMSGPGLGHTGGTVDKLGSIPGFRTMIPPEEFIKIAEKVGVVISAAGADLDPADKKLYALRDVTATVGCIPLIVSSIMSKKLAGGARSIVLDVKTGSGAFMKTLPESRLLAENMVKIGILNGKNVTAVITDMDSPLGNEIGNINEVLEAVKVLRGEIKDGDLYDVCVRLASELVAMGKNISAEEAEISVKEALSSGKAYNKFKEWIKAQGGDVDILSDPSFGKANYVSEVISPAEGYLVPADTAGIGISAMLLGAGRASKEDNIDPTAGITLVKKYGDHVKKGDVLAIMRSSAVQDHAAAQERFISSHSFLAEKPSPRKVVYGVVRGKDI